MKNFFQKVFCVSILAGKFFTYKLTRQRVEFWGSIYDSMEIKNKYSFYESCLIKFLFFSARDDANSEKICNVFEKFRPGISKKELPATDLIMVFFAAVREERREVADRIIKISEKNPDYFPPDSLKEFKSAYDDTFI